MKKTITKEITARFSGRYLIVSGLILVRTNVFYMTSAHAGRVIIILSGASNVSPSLEYDIRAAHRLSNYSHPRQISRRLDAKDGPAFDLIISNTYIKFKAILGVLGPGLERLTNEQKQLQLGL